MFDQLLTAIREAKLPAPVYRTAREFLDRTGANGYVRLSYDEAMAIAQTDKPETLRGHLAQLQAKGLITYRRNREVHVMWHIHGARMDTQIARVDIQIARTDGDTETVGVGESNNLYIQPNNLYIQPRATRAEQTLPVGKNLPTGKVSREVEPTYLPAVEGVQGEPQPLTDAERSLALLTDPAVGVTGKLLELATLYSFEQIRLQVFQALRQMADPNSRIKSIGVIEHRLKVNAGATITDADRASDLWQRHETEDEADTARRRKYIPEGYEHIIIH